jgi:hypothetical protein
MPSSISQPLNFVSFYYCRYKILAKSFLIVCITTGFSNIAQSQDKQLETTTSLTPYQLWKNKLTSDSGNINFTTALNQNGRLTLVFSNHKTMSPTHDLIRITISDQDCIGEHEASISFKENKKNTLTRYFTERTPWKQDMNLSITWTEDRLFTVKLNDQPLPISIQKKSKYIYLMSNQSIELKNFKLIQ